MADESDLPLQEVLQADSSGERTREMLALIGKSQNLMRGRLRGQHPAAEFKAAEQLALALDASERVIRNVWESYHGRQLH
jgi:hypothetical protein